MWAWLDTPNKVTETVKTEMVSDNLVDKIANDLYIPEVTEEKEKEEKEEKEEEEKEEEEEEAEEAEEAEWEKDLDKKCDTKMTRFVKSVKPYKYSFLFLCMYVVHGYFHFYYKGNKC